jgi:hypothetical protein
LTAYISTSTKENKALVGLQKLKGRIDGGVLVLTQKRERDGGGVLV